MPVGDYIGDMIPTLLPVHPLGTAPPSAVPTATEIFGAAGKGGYWTPDTSKTVQPDGMGGFDVTAWDDEAGTKTLDGTAAPPALAIAALDGHDGLRFDGLSEYMSLSGLGWVTNDRPSLFVVNAENTIGADTIDTPAFIENASFNRFFIAGQMRTDGSNDLFRAVASLSDGLAALSYGAPLANDDTDPHLHEAHAAATGFTRAFDAAEAVSAETGGLQSALTILMTGANNLSAPAGYLDGDVYEIVMADDGYADRQAYRDTRIAPYYPTVGANFP